MCRRKETFGTFFGVSGESWKRGSDHSGGRSIKELRMEVPFPRLQVWVWGKKEESAVSGEISMNSSSDWGFDGLREPETVKLSAVSGRSKMKKRGIEREDDDIVVVSSDGSESDDSDWSIGWLEPHGSDFLSDDETDDSFAVLVPCYRHNSNGWTAELSINPILGALTDAHFTDDDKPFMEQWLTSLHNC